MAPPREGATLSFAWTSSVSSDYTKEDLHGGDEGADCVWQRMSTERGRSDCTAHLYKSAGAIHERRKSLCVLYRSQQQPTARVASHRKEGVLVLCS